MSDILGVDSPLAEIYPEAKLTMKDKLPMNFILTNALITIQKSILNIQYSAEEIREAVQGFVAMIPDLIKDEKYNEEIERAKQKVSIDVRPVNCGVRASLEYCKQRGIPMVREVETFDYFAVLHACFNLLMRKEMLLTKQPKEIMTGNRARGGEKETGDKAIGEEEEFEPETQDV